MQLNLNEYEAFAIARAIRSRGGALKKQTSTASQMELAANRSVAKKIKASLSQPALFDEPATGTANEGADD